jgi:hypothetical protein
MVAPLDFKNLKTLVDVLAFCCCVDRVVAQSGKGRLLLVSRILRGETAATVGGGCSKAIDGKQTKLEV